jgi:predicted transcriptional regulator
LGVLEKNQLVSSLVDGRHRRFFPVGGVDWTKRGQVAALKNDRTRTIYELIADDPGIIQGDLAGRVGISVPAAIWHLKRLEDTGLVGREKKGRKVHYFANEAEYVPQPYDPGEAVEVA